MRWEEEAVQSLVQERFPGFTEQVAELIPELRRKHRWADTGDQVLDAVWPIVNRSRGFSLPDSQEPEEDELDARMSDESDSLTEFGRQRLRAYLDRALSYKAELEDLSYDDRDEFRRRYKLSLAAARERTEASAAERDARYFDNPEDDADYQHWQSFPAWTLDQAVALSFGKDPRRINSKTKRNPGSLFMQRYKDRLEAAELAMDVGDLKDPQGGHLRNVRPKDFAEWYLSAGISLPPSFPLDQLEARDWKAEYLKAATQLQSQHSQIADLEAKLGENITTTTKTTLFTMIIAMAVHRYGYTTTPYNKAASQIRQAIQSINQKAGESVLKLDDDTIRERSREAATHLDFQWPIRSEQSGD
jgi:hypothetical protein